MRKFWRKMRRRKNIDFRKDPAPTDWGAKLEGKYAHLGGDFKTDEDYLNEFIEELNGKRCEPVCVNGQLDHGQLGHGQLSNGQLSVGMPPVGCVCSLVERLANAEDDLVPVGEFLAVVEAAGYSREQTLEQYKHYAIEKIGQKYDPEFERLDTEADNAYNWSTEFAFTEFKEDETDPYDALSEVHEELEALVEQIDREVEAEMSQATMPESTMSAEATNRPGPQPAATARRSAQ